MPSLLQTAEFSLSRACVHNIKTLTYHFEAVIYFVDDRLPVGVMVLGLLPKLSLFRFRVLWIVGRVFFAKKSSGVHSTDDPRWTALEAGAMRPFQLRQLRKNLDSRRSVANDGNAFSAIVVAVIPCC